MSLTILTLLTMVPMVVAGLVTTESPSSLLHYRVSGVSAHSVTLEQEYEIDYGRKCYELMYVAKFHWALCSKA